MIVKYENINETCRICLQEINVEYSYSFLGHITLEDIGTSFNIPYLIYKITNEEIDEKNMHLLPQRVCWKCVDLLKATYMFKVTYNKSVAVLKEHLDNFIATVIKVEPPSLSEGCINIDSPSPPLSDGSGTKEETIVINPTIKSRPKLHQCPFCNKMFTALKLRKHAQNQHLDVKKYIKGVPKVKKSARFHTVNARNIQPYFLKDPTLHMCPFCEKFLPEQHFADHVTTHKANDEFTCNICNRVFGHLKALNVHKWSHKKNVPFRCKICKKGFMAEQNLQYHMNVHKKELPFTCEFCGKSFHNPVLLKRHVTEHTQEIPYNGNLKYKIKCKSCWRRFKNSRELEGHTCRPIPKKPPAPRKQYRYRTCKTCWQKFESMEVLKSHHCVPREMPEQAKKRYPVCKKLCALCGKYVPNITYHMLTHTGERPHVCPKCGKRFAMQAVFRKHVRSHDDIKPFICDLCGKGFRERTHLCAHEKTHLGVKKHACLVCNQKFLEKACMKRHLKKVHGANKLD